VRSIITERGPRRSVSGKRTSGLVRHVLQEAGEDDRPIAGYVASILLLVAMCHRAHGQGGGDDSAPTSAILR
jgi:hypothetical protein